MLYLIIAAILAIVVVGIARAIWPTNDPILDIVRTIVICLLCSLWVILLPFAAIVGGVWGLSEFVKRQVVKVRR